MDQSNLKNKTICVLSDQHYYHIGDLLYQDSVMAFTQFTENADVVLVLFADDQQQWDQLGKLCRSPNKKQIVITRPVLGFDLMARSHPNLCCFSYKAYSSSILNFTNEARMRGMPQHVEMAECGGWGLFNEWFQQMSMLWTIVGGSNVFNRLTPRINRKDWGGTLSFHGRENDTTASLFVTLKQARYYFSSQSAFGSTGKLARMDNREGTSYIETWGAGMAYTVATLSGGNRGIIERNRQMAIDICSKIKTVRGAANLLLD